MKRKLYAVVRQGGQWGIRTRGAPFFSCESFQEALDIAISSAEILTSQETRQEAENRHGDDSSRLPSS
jgi:hypothetical protein